MGNARLEIWDRANTTRLAEAWTVDADLHQRNIDDLSPTGMKLNEPGSGGFVVQRDHPAAIAGHIKARNRVRVYSGTNLVYAFTIGETDDTQITKKQSDKIIKLQGDDLVDDLAGVVVEPWLKGNNARPVSQDRVWNWTGTGLVGWSNPVNITRPTIAQKQPEAWPVAEIFNSYIWSQALTGLSHPIGSCPFGADITVAADGAIVIYAGADNMIDSIWSDKVLLDREVVPFPSQDGFRKTHRWAFKVSAGTHELRAMATNWAGGALNPAGFISATFYVTADKTLGEVINTTAAVGMGWKCLDYPTTLPGFTPVQILNMLFDEAHARNELLGWTIEAHGTFAQMPEFSCRVGSKYSEVLAALAATSIDYRTDYAGLKLHIYPKGTMGSTVALDLDADSITEMSVVTDAEFYNVIAGIWAEGVTWRSHAGSITAMGERRSTAESLGGITELAAVNEILDARLEAVAFPAESIVGEFVDLPGKTAGVDYKVADKLKLLTGDVQCVGLTWTIDRAGDLVPHPEWDAISGVRRRERGRAVERMIAKFESPSSASMIGSDSMIFTGVPSTKEWKWSWNGEIADFEDSDKPTQIEQSETSQRLYRFLVDTDIDDLPDAWGDTRIRIVKNGADLNPLYDLVLNTTTWAAEIPIWAYETITPADKFQLRFVADGGHVDGAAVIRLAELV